MEGKECGSEEGWGREEEGDFNVNRGCCREDGGFDDGGWCLRWLFGFLIYMDGGMVGFVYVYGVFWFG